MSTTPVNPGGINAAAITYPLAPAVRKAYNDLYETTKQSLRDTEDTDAVNYLSDVLLWVGNVLEADDKAQIAANDPGFAILKKTITDANAGLKKVQGDMESVAKKIGTLATVISGITTVLSYFPAI